MLDKRSAGFVVADLQQSLVAGTRLDLIPELIERIAEDECWRDRIHTDGQVFHFETPMEWINAQPPGGMGGCYDDLRRLCGKNRHASDWLESLTVRPVGTNQHSEGLDNIQGLAPTGTSQDAAFRRLRKDRSDLHQRVLDGEMSAHRAMIEAGFRSRKLSVPVDTPEAAIRALLRRFSADELRGALKDE
jgi:hypothetical protein